MLPSSRRVGCGCSDRTMARVGPDPAAVVSAFGCLVRGGVCCLRSRAAVCGRAKDPLVKRDPTSYDCASPPGSRDRSHSIARWLGDTGIGCGAVGPRSHEERPWCRAHGSRWPRIRRGAGHVRPTGGAPISRHPSTVMTGGCLPPARSARAPSAHVPQSDRLPGTATATLVRWGLNRSAGTRPATQGSAAVVHGRSESCWGHFSLRQGSSSAPARSEQTCTRERPTNASWTGLPHRTRRSQSDPTSSRVPRRCGPSDARANGRAPTARGRSRPTQGTGRSHSPLWS